MRNHVINALIERAKIDDSIVLLVGDLGFNVVEEFAIKFPDRFINCGIAEQNMLSVAAGMALEGDKVFVYSIGNFPTLRCLEQIRNDVCYHKANVNILATGGGFSYGSLGMSHHATEELGILRALPEMRIYAPADYHEAILALDDVLNNSSPSYIRLARGSDAVIHNDVITCPISQLIPYGVHNEKPEVVMISTGTILEEAVKVADVLIEKGISTQVFSCPTIKPIDRNTIIQIGKISKLIVSLEEHNVYCGLGSAIAEVLCALSHHASLLICGLNDTYSSEVGSREYLRSYYGLDSVAITNKIIKRLTYL